MAKNILTAFFVSTSLLVLTPLWNRDGKVKPKKDVLTDQELEIMKVVWQRGKATVRDVYEELLKHRKIAYTTVMTMMGILEQKGRLSKSDSERAFVYTPAQPQGEV